MRAYYPGCTLLGPTPMHALRLSALLAFGLAVAGCESADGIIPAADVSVANELASYRLVAAPHQLEIAPVSEPGQRLILLGTLIDRDSGEPLPGREIRVIHTNAEGNYEEAVAGDETTARLSGEVVSGPEGRFMVSTVFPGGYGSAEGSGGHIHTSIASARPEAYDFHFAPFAGAGIRRWVEQRRQGAILDLYSMGDTLIAIGTLPIGLPDSTSR
ncbi:MAG: hypothetical protein Rubg2KO_06690 [Rubricoccaceae bacterium]